MKKIVPLASRQVSRDTHERVSSGLAQKGRCLMLCRRPAWSSGAQHLLALLCQRERPAATTLRRMLFGYPSLLDEGLKVPCQRRPILMVPSSEFGAIRRDEHPRSTAG